MSPLTIRLDSPIDEKEAKGRGIDCTLSRLLIGGPLNMLAELMGVWCPSGKKISICAIGSFVSFDDIFRVLKNYSVQGDLGCELFFVEGKEELELVLSRWNAEILVAFFADDATARRIVETLMHHEPKWWRYSQKDFTGPFLAQLELVDPYVFFSPSLGALEVIGTDKRVLHCLESAIRMR